MPISSMADIAFLLLIFFMLTSIMDMEKEIPIQLPISQISISEAKTYFNIWINRSGHYFFDGKRNNLHNLINYAQYRKSISPDIKALIRADKDLPYEYINNVLEVLIKAGLHNIVLVTKKEIKD